MLMWATRCSSQVHSLMNVKAVIFFFSTEAISFFHSSITPCLDVGGVYLGLALVKRLGCGVCCLSPPPAGDGSGI